MRFPNGTRVYDDTKPRYLSADQDLLRLTLMNIDESKTYMVLWVEYHMIEYRFSWETQRELWHVWRRFRHCL